MPHPVHSRQPSDTFLMRCLRMRPLLAGLGCALLLSGCKATISDAPIAPAPNVGILWTAPTTFSLKNKGYERQEFFFRGTANAYVNTAPLTSEGQWEVAPSGETAEYKSRMIVYKPIDPAKFNGTVVIEWMNVSSSVDTPTAWINAHTELMRKGYAYVAVSAQQVGIEGGSIPLPKLIPLCLSAKCVSRARYDSLHHPGDSFSYDIFRQAAEFVRYPQDLNPLGTLTPSHIIAMGQSQSAHRLITFVNAFGKSTDVFDGYFIHSRLGSGITELGGGGSASLSQAPQEDINPPAIVKIREDLGLPIMNLQAETDQLSLGAAASRQQDSDHFRLWEMAGSAHADVYVSYLGLGDNGNNPNTAAVRLRRTAVPVFDVCKEPINSAPQHHFMVKAALRALNSWIVDDIAPPSFPLLQINAAGDGFETDEYGNVLGGVRSPWVDVPTAQLSGQNTASREKGLCFLFGSTKMLDDATLHALYPTHDAYVAAMTASAQEAVNAGTLLPEDVKLVIDAAKAANVPPVAIEETEFVAEE